VLRGGFGLWLGNNIVIFSMVKQEHLLFLTCYGPTLYLDSLTARRYIGRIFSQLQLQLQSKFLMQQQKLNPLVEAP
jgi:hypothetical protein